MVGYLSDSDIDISGPIHYEYHSVSVQFTTVYDYYLRVQVGLKSSVRTHLSLVHVEVVNDDTNKQVESEK